MNERTNLIVAAVFMMLLANVIATLGCAPRVVHTVHPFPVVAPEDAEDTGA